MTKPLRLDDEATEELSCGVRWYEERRKGLGREFLLAVDKTLTSINAMPQANSLAPGIDERLGVRRRLVKRFPFAIFYLELELEIRVLAIAHSRRKPFYWQDRL